MGCVNAGAAYQKPPGLELLPSGLLYAAFSGKMRVIKKLGK